MINEHVLVNLITLDTHYFQASLILRFDKIVRVLGIVTTYTGRWRKKVLSGCMSMDKETCAQMGAMTWMGSI